jgi:hypothetical protein
MVWIDFSVVTAKEIYLHIPTENLFPEYVKLVVTKLIGVGTYKGKVESVQMDILNSHTMTKMQTSVKITKWP